MQNIAVIDSFEGDYHFLSNFYSFPITYEGYTFQNNEAAFQAAKCPERMQDFCGLNPNEAKYLGLRVRLRPDWEEVKAQIMYEICKVKFEDEELRQMLLDTGDAELICGNTWGDTIWGFCDGEGENRLGKILMRIRTEAKNET